MNCVSVLRRAKMRDLGRLLVEHMVEGERKMAGFATIALENRWSSWSKKDQIERLGFKSVSSIALAHKTKHKDHVSGSSHWDASSRESQRKELEQIRTLRGPNFLHGPFAIPSSEVKKSLRQNKRV